MQQMVKTVATCTTDVVNLTHKDQVEEPFLPRKQLMVGKSEIWLWFFQHLWKHAVLISPFFFWGTSMVAMKAVLPKVGPFFMSSFRLLPAGVILIVFASSKACPMPRGLRAWFSIFLFSLVHGTCFQGFLAQGLKTTSAGLGSVIINSQPLTVAVLAALLLGESINRVAAAGLVLGVVGLVLLETPMLIKTDGSEFSLWASGEWWMLLAAQCMAIGTVMVRWVSKYSDPVMATGWHMVIGGIPLLMVAWVNQEPAFRELSAGDFVALVYTTVFGGAISYGVFFYNATIGSLTRLSSLTFLTPVFASVFGFGLLGESFSSIQLVGAVITLAGIYMIVTYEGERGRSQERKQRCQDRERRELICEDQGSLLCKSSGSDRNC